MGGRDILHSMLMLVPAAWQGDASTPTEVKEFYEYHQCLKRAGGRPRRAGLQRRSHHRRVPRPQRPAPRALQDFRRRPAHARLRGRPCLTVDDAKVIEKGRLGPGEMIAVDTVKGVLLRNDDIKKTYATKKPYGQWLRENIKDIVSTPSLESQPSPGATLLQHQLCRRLHRGGTQHHALRSSRSWARRARKPSARWATTPRLAVLSRKPRLLYTYFKQLFAQVTNPPIDPIRERLVMSVEVLAGQHRNWLEESPEHAKLLRLQSPIITNPEMQQILALKDGAFKVATLNCRFPVSERPPTASRSISTASAPRRREGRRRRRVATCAEATGTSTRRTRRSRCCSPPAR